MKEPITQAEFLTVEAIVNEQSVCIKFNIDNILNERILIEFPFKLTKYTEIAQALFGMMGSIFLGQLCLAKNIHITSPVLKNGMDDLGDIICCVYNIRSFRDNLDIFPLPNIMTTSYLAYEKVTIESRSNKACQLFSGGLDSALSIDLLKFNGYSVNPVYVDINLGAESGEKKAVSEICNALDLTLDNIGYKFDNYLDIAKKYSNVIGQFPNENNVPHGRELLLLAVSLIIAIEKKCSVICFGHENNAWTRSVQHRGLKVNTGDTQSEPANISFQKFIDKFISSSIRLFSPVSPLSDYLKFEMLALNNPTLLSMTNGCFWGNWCGQCAKCSVYFIMQSMLKTDLLKFKKNPLSNSEKIYNVIHNWEDTNQTNWKEYHFALSSIVSQNLLQSDSNHLLKHYKHHVLGKVSPLLEDIKGELLAIHDVALLPTEFNFPISSSSGA